MGRFTIYFICSLLIISCAPKKQHESAPPPEQHVTHTVRWSGETLGIIAAWYTKSSANWPEIAAANPGLEIKNIRIGDSINIPERLVLRREEMPAEFLNNSATAVPTQNGLGSVESAAAAPSVPATEDAIETAEAASEPKEENINSSLWRAVSFMDAQEVKSLLAAGADANHRENGRHMLAWAAQNGDVPVVEALLAGKARIDDIDGVGHTALMRAVDLNQKEVVDALIKAGANLNIKKPGEGATALSLAINSGYTDVVRTLVKAGADVNVTTDGGDSLVLIAAQWGYPEIITILGEAKADMNVSNIVYTPLTYAIEQGNKELVKTILDAGADPNAKPKTGRVPLAMAMDNKEIFELLLAAKADPNLVDDSGDTPLMTAVQYDYIDCIEPLIKAGANLQAKSSSGSTALVLAQNLYKTEMIEVLKKHGAVE